MIALRRFLLAGAGGLLLAPFAAVAHSEPQPDETPRAARTPAPRPQHDTVREKAGAQDKRICRFVRADPSRRRKNRLCRTSEEWRDLDGST